MEIAFGVCKKIYTFDLSGGQKKEAQSEGRPCQSTSSIIPKMLLLPCQKSRVSKDRVWGFDLTYLSCKIHVLLCIYHT